MSARLSNTMTGSLPTVNRPEARIGIALKFASVTLEKAITRAQNISDSVSSSSAKRSKLSRALAQDPVATAASR